MAKQTKTFREVVGEAIGEASMCWSKTPKGEFDSTRASKLIDKVLVALVAAGVPKALREAKELLELADPAGARVAHFGNRVAEDGEVLELCERHGFGAVMDSAARQWRLKDPIGAHTTGASVACIQRGLEWVSAALAELEAA